MSTHKPQKIEVEEIISRMATALGVTNDYEIAGFLGKKSSAYISTWRREGRAPETQVALVAVKKNVSFKWLMTGEGSPRSAKDDNPQINEEVSSWPPQKHKELIDAFDQLTEDEQKFVIRMLRGAVV